MQKTVTYLYPNDKKASNLKMFQEGGNQIVGCYFTKEGLKDIESLPNTANCAVYFLFNNSEEDESRVYIGQSVNGIARIKNHVENKEFWTFCIMFVTNNNCFDRLSIDYLEYEFIKKFRSSSYILTNKANRYNQPNYDIFKKPIFEKYLDQIEFLLSTEGIVLSEPEMDLRYMKYYFPKSENYIGKLYVQDGKFIICKDSVLVRPLEKTKDYSGNLFSSFNAQIDSFIVDGKVKEVDNKLITVIDLAFSKPSRAAVLISGISANGWTFFVGLDEQRSN
jgi:hypothetical protein